MGSMLGSLVTTADSLVTTNGSLRTTAGSLGTTGGSLVNTAINLGTTAGSLGEFPGATTGACPSVAPVEGSELGGPPPADIRTMV